MSKERDFLDELLVNERVTSDEYEEAVYGGAFKKLAEILHSLLCRDNHAESGDGVLIGFCAYYQEDRLDNTWELPSHDVWVLRAHEMVDTLSEITRSTVTPGQVIDYVERATDITKNYHIGTLYIIHLFIEEGLIHAPSLIPDSIMDDSDSAF
ncbi:hypothetical protein LCGC14_0981380 [marine sediment metagenome]|uniref:Uncharacterized protein n=1 Tax=marine sediment metagenome TaxID=412755 RepID=A0A0F9ND27_9ZZZZ